MDLFSSAGQETIINGAAFSNYRQYRYSLWRIWERAGAAHYVYRVEPVNS